MGWLLCQTLHTTLLPITHVMRDSLLVETQAEHVSLVEPGLVVYPSVFFLVIDIIYSIMYTNNIIFVFHSVS